MSSTSQKCPNCGLENGLFVANDRHLTCWSCGYKAEEAIEDENSDADPRKRWPVSYSTHFTPEIDRWAETKFYSGMDYLNQEKYDEAIQSFKQAIEQQKDFVEAHLWIARISLDPEEKRQHYEDVHVYAPNLLEATRELMVLNGQLTREEADRTLNASQEQTVLEVEQAVSAKLETIACSSCGGTLEVPEGETEVRCEFCGHIEKIAERDSGVQSLTMALLKERGKSTHWKIGKYFLHCDNCSAERVITSKNMTLRCPFCGSEQVVKSDALNTFRQPEGILPFTVKRKDAQTQLQEALNSPTEKFKGFFVNNKVDKVRLNPVYLPYWVFDVTAQITKTRIERRSTTREEYGDALNNVPYCAVESPPRNLVERLPAFDFSDVQSYDPKRLANFTAQLYSIDFQQASIDVRTEIGERFRFRHGHNPHGDVQIHVAQMIQQMSFRLLMLPIWIANIVEDDGDLRLALIHGQKGRVVLGKAYKPDS